MYDYIQKLMGKYVTKILTDGEYYLTFETTDGNYHFQLTGDCCSQSYITEIMGVRNFIDKGQITTVDESDLGDEKNDYDRILKHGVYLRCAGGDSYGDPPTLVILWENSSNGYYDGMIESIDAIPNETKMFEIQGNWKKPKNVAS